MSNKHVRKARMNWDDYKEQMGHEWAFYKRNPEFPILMILWLGTIIWVICSK